MAHQNSGLDGIFSALREDAKAPFPKFPSQSLHAFKHEDVAKAVSTRFQRGERLRNIRALEYDFTTGLNRLCFEFDSSSSLTQADILVLLDTNCKVVGFLDPFDADQPNRMVPPLSAMGGSVPFVLERPSVSSDLPFNEQDVAEYQSRTEGFMVRVFGGANWGGLGGGGLNEDPCGPEAQGTQCTFCSAYYMSVYPAATRWDRGIRQMDCSQMDIQEDDCGIPF